MNVVLHEVRHRNEMSFGEVASDAERSTHVLAVDQDVHQSSDPPSPGPDLAAGGDAPEGPENDSGILLTAFLPVGCHPSVVVEAVAKHPAHDRANTEGTLGTRREMSKHVSDSPLDTQ